MTWILSAIIICTVNIYSICLSGVSGLAPDGFRSVPYQANAWGAYGCVTRCSKSLSFRAINSRCIPAIQKENKCIRTQQGLSVRSERMNLQSFFIFPVKLSVNKDLSKDQSFVGALFLYTNLQKERSSKMTTTATTYTPNVLCSTAGMSEQEWLGCAMRS